MHYLKLKKNEYGYFRISDQSKGYDLVTLASLLTDSTHIKAVKEMLSDSKLDQVSGNRYTFTKEENGKIGIYDIYVEDGNNDILLLLDKERLSYLINTWETLNSQNVNEITITYNDGKYEMVGK